MDKKLKKTGMTKTMMWQEYIAKYPDGCMHSQLLEHYGRWSKQTAPVMHIKSQCTCMSQLSMKPPWILRNNIIPLFSRPGLISQEINPW
jgi:hypothetical protein